MEQGMRTAAVSIALATLAACGGGGGGGGGGGSAVAVGAPPPSEVTFTSFAAILPNQTVVMDGTAFTANGNQNSVAATSANLNALGPATVRLSYDSSPTPALRYIDISTPSTPIAAFDRDITGPGHSFGCSGGTCVAETPTASVAVIDPVAAGWNYQSLGVWTMDVTPTTWVAGAASFGAATSGNALPTTGTAVFNGLTAGFYLDSGGTPFGTVGAMRADVDFSGRSIQFSTSGTSRINGITSVRTPDTGLNLSGTLSYAPGVNSFSGAVQTANGQLTGQGSGRFYGPTAQEIGGVYSLSGAGVSRMIGGFGGKR
jgi:transferrin binding protein